MRCSLANVVPFQRAACSANGASLTIHDRYVSPESAAATCPKLATAVRAPVSAEPNVAPPSLESAKRMAPLIIQVTHTLPPAAAIHGLSTKLRPSAPDTASGVDQVAP